MCNRYLYTNGSRRLKHIEVEMVRGGYSGDAKGQVDNEKWL